MKTQPEFRVTFLNHNGETVNAIHSYQTYEEATAKFWTLVEQILNHCVDSEEGSEVFLQVVGEDPLHSYAYANPLTGSSFHRTTRFMEFGFSWDQDQNKWRYGLYWFDPALNDYVTYFQPDWEAFKESFAVIGDIDT